MRWDLDAALRRMAEQIEENDALLARLAPADGNVRQWVQGPDDGDELLEPLSHAAPMGYVLC